MNSIGPVPPTEIMHEADGSRVEHSEIPISAPELQVAHNRVLRKEELRETPRPQRGTLLSLCSDLFLDHRDEVMFGPCVQGAVFELRLSREPEQFSYLDGYLTVSLEPEPAHMHLCIGPHVGLKEETPAGLRDARRCGRAYFARSLRADGSPSSWSIVMENGVGQQMITFFLPTPYMDTQKQKFLREPNYGALKLWNKLRADYLGELTPQPLPPPRRVVDAHAV